MSINDFLQKIKSRLSGRIYPWYQIIKKGLDIKPDIFIVFVIIFIGLIGFGLGRLSALEKKRQGISVSPAVMSANGFISVVNDKPAEEISVNKEIFVPMSAAALVATEKAEGFLVASKSGQKYHFPWCGGASQIVAKNKIWFDTYEEARQAGYLPAANCPGLK